ncbi:MAG: hypothetical protein DCC68_18125 [Planctomycetota bacterium]|nr:MAG: hypothetical protein DCC68_18125 [Planctomycetota bacterium]
MLWIVENPWPVVAAGIAVELFLVVKLFTTGRLKMVMWMVVAAAVVGGYWLVERAIVTDREQIETNLHAVAAAMERNDVAAVEKYIDKASPHTLSEARQAARLPFAEVRINNDLKIDVVAEDNPPTAEASGSVTVAMTSGFTKPTLVQATVKLRKIDGEWLIYRHEKPRIGIR